MTHIFSKISSLSLSCCNILYHIWLVSFVQQERCESGESSKADSPKQSKESWYEDDRSDDEIFGGDEEEDESHYQYQDEDLFDDFDT